MAAPMDDAIGLLSSSKTSDRELRKTIKKQRHKIMQFKHRGVDIVDDPTNHLVVLNGGLDNGVSRSQLEDVFNSFGEVLEITMQPGQSYAYVSYATIDQTKLAYEAVTGKKIALGDRRLALYLGFVDQVPGLPTWHHNPPPGLILLENFVTEEEEALMLAQLNWDADDNVESGASAGLKHRMVKHFGYEFMYSTNNVDLNKPLAQSIPTWCDDITQRLLEKGHLKHIPDQLTVNHYVPGQGIPPHIDTHSAFEDEITAISLGSQVVMDFRHSDGRHVPVVLPRRSAVVMTGECRYAWTHGITPRKSDVVPAPDHQHPAGRGRLTTVQRSTRTSFTFRKVLARPCQCDYLDQCDSQQQVAATKAAVEDAVLLPSTNEEAATLETDHVHKVYDEIAGHFSQTRHTPWPRVAEFLSRQPPAAIVVDVGCGNGKYLGCNPQLFKVGCDRSVNLCSICRERGHEVFVCDALSVPLRPQSVDVAISIAVIHHMANKDRRRDAVRELWKVLRPGGQCLISVWAFEQERRNVKSNYLDESKIGRQRKGGDAKAVTCEGDDGAVTHVKKNCEHKCTRNDKDACVCGEDLAMTEEETTTHDSSDDVRPASPDVDAAVRPKLGIHLNRTNFEAQDVLVPWHKKTKEVKGGVSTDGPVFHRFYHVFREGELEALCEELPDVEIVESYYDKGNWCVIFSKTLPSGLHVENSAKMS